MVQVTTRRIGEEDGDKH